MPYESVRVIQCSNDRLTTQNHRLNRQKDLEQRRRFGQPHLLRSTFPRPNERETRLSVRVEIRIEADCEKISGDSATILWLLTSTGSGSLECDDRRNLRVLCASDATSAGEFERDERRTKWNEHVEFE